MFKKTLRAARASIAIVVTLVALPAPAAASADDVRITRAEAGLGGVVQAGRWAPVRVTLESFADDVAGELRVTWGGSTVRRHIALPSPGTWEFDLYIRTADAPPSMQIAVSSGSMNARSVTITTATPQPGAAFNLCVVSGQALSTDTSRCSAVMRPAELPHSVLGYDAIDRVTWMAQEADVPLAQRGALSAWRSLQGLDQAGDLSLTPSVTTPVVRAGLPADTARLVTLEIGGLVTGLLAIGFLSTTRALRLGTACLLAGTAGAVGIAAAAGTGRIGAPDPIHIRHASLLQQIPGTPSSRLTVRGIADFPAFGAFSVTLPIDAAMLQTSGPSAREERVFDEAGHPRFGGRYGLGARRGFSAEAMLDLQPLAVMSSEKRVTVSNTSALHLLGCRFGEGFASGGAITLRPGESVEAERVMDGIGPVLTCRHEGAPLTRFDGGDRQIESTGTTVIAVYERRDAPPVDGLTDRHEAEVGR